MGLESRIARNYRPNKKTPGVFTIRRGSPGSLSSRARRRALRGAAAMPPTPQRPGEWRRAVKAVRTRGAGRGPASCPPALSAAATRLTHVLLLQSAPASDLAGVAVGTRPSVRRCKPLRRGAWPHTPSRSRASRNACDKAPPGGPPGERNTRARSVAGEPTKPSHGWSPLGHAKGPH